MPRMSGNVMAAIPGLAASKMPSTMLSTAPIITAARDTKMFLLKMPTIISMIPNANKARPSSKVIIS